MNIKKSLFVSVALVGAVACSCFTAPTFARGKAGTTEATRDLNTAQRSLYTMIESLWKGKQDNAIHITLSASGRVYHFGQTMKLRLVSNKDAYVVLIDQGASGRTHYLLPNRWHHHPLHLKAHTPVLIPADNAPWTVTVGGPRGAEMVYAIASNKPLSHRQRNYFLREIKAGHPFPEAKHPTRAVFRDLFVKRGKVTRGTASLKLHITP